MQLGHNIDFEKNWFFSFSEDMKKKIYMHSYGLLINKQFTTISPEYEIILDVFIQVVTEDLLNVDKNFILKIHTKENAIKIDSVTMQPIGSVDLMNNKYVKLFELKSSSINEIYQNIAAYHNDFISRAVTYTSYINDF